MGLFRKARQSLHLRALTGAGDRGGATASRHPDAAGTAPSPPPVPTAAASAPAPDAASPPAPASDVIAKAVTVQVWVDVTGSQAAPEDFAALATTAIRQALAGRVTAEGIALALRVVRTAVD